MGEKFTHLLFNRLPYCRFWLWIRNRQDHPVEIPSCLPIAIHKKLGRLFINGTVSVFQGLMIRTLPTNVAFIMKALVLSTGKMNINLLKDI